MRRRVRDFNLGSASPKHCGFIHVFLNQRPRFCESFGLEAVARVQFHGRLDPELRLALGMLHVHVRAGLLARKEVEPKPLDAQDRWTHAASIAQGRDGLDAMEKGEMSGATNEVG